jgi:chromate reductase
MHRMKVLIFAGSTRQQSYNRKLARVTAEMARNSGAEVTISNSATSTCPCTTPIWKR